MNRDFEKRLPSDEALTRLLRSLPRRSVPEQVRSSLRVLASHEQHRAAGKGIAWLDRVRLFSRDLMRPLALPFAGGIFSTIVLFSMSGPTYSAQVPKGFEIPIPLSLRSQATVLTSDRGGAAQRDPTVLKTAPMLAYGADDVIVDVMVDGQGHMIDYAIVSGDASNNDALRRSIGALLLLTEFHPATTLGRPVAGRVRLLLPASHSSVDVKG
jgi:hypothetical protein